MILVTIKALSRQLSDIKICNPGCYPKFQNYFFILFDNGLYNPFYFTY